MQSLRKIHLRTGHKGPEGSCFERNRRCATTTPILQNMRKSSAGMQMAVQSDYFLNTASVPGSASIPQDSLHNSENPAGSDKRKQAHKKSVQKRVKLRTLLNADKILPLSINGSRTPTCGLNRLKDSFYDVSCEDLAKRLLGKILVRRLNDGTVLKGRVVETECYPGGEDKASHSYNGRITERSKPMYMKPGTTYVYITYGMYHCFNISSQGAGAAVLLRALEPLQGLEFMQLERQKGRRTTATAAMACKELQAHDLCNGPAKLCMSFSITKSSCNEQDLTVWDGMWIEEDDSEEEALHIVTSHRIGIDSVGTEWALKPFRFYLLGNSSVSRRDKSREKQLQKMIGGFP